LALIVGASLFLGWTAVAVAAPNGADLAKKCERCHGDNGNSDKEQVPSIAGFSTSYFIDTMAAYKSGDRQGKKFKTEGHDETDMKTIADEPDIPTPPARL
jgi:sulfide dehydrogenase cytochrome subunit